MHTLRFISHLVPLLVLLDIVSHASLSEVRRLHRFSLQFRGALRRRKTLTWLTATIERVNEGVCSDFLLEHAVFWRPLLLRLRVLVVLYEELGAFRCVRLTSIHHHVDSLLSRLLPQIEPQVVLLVGDPTCFTVPIRREFLRWSRDWDSVHLLLQPLTLSYGKVLQYSLLLSHYGLSNFCTFLFITIRRVKLHELVETWPTFIKAIGEYARRSILRHIRWH